MGVDPGLGGGLYFHDINDVRGNDAFKMPTKLVKEGSRKRQIDLTALGVLVQMYAADTKFMVIENVHSMPHDGHVGAFTFGKAFGIVLGMVAGHGIPTHFVEPSVWKGLMGLSSDKKQAMAKAQKIFGVNWCDGIAEAALIAKFGERFL